MKEEKYSHQREIDGIPKKGEQQALCQFLSPFSEKNDAEQLYRFIEDNTENPDGGAESGYNRSEGKDEGKEDFRNKVSRRDGAAAVFASAPAEKVREDGNLLPEGKLAATGFTEAVTVSHRDRMPF